MANENDKQLMAELVMFKKELQEKTGKYEAGGTSSKKEIVDQEQFLKQYKMRKNKKDEANDELEYSKYTRTSNYEIKDEVEFIIDRAKAMQWKEPRSMILINVLLCCYMISGDMKRAEMEYKKGSAIEVSNIDFLYNSAEFFLRKGKYEYALEYLAKLLKLSNDEDAFYLTGIILFMQGNQEMAVSLINKTILADKNSKRVYKNLLLIGMIMGSDFGKVIELSENLVNEDGKNIAARVLNGYMELQNDNFENYKNQERMIKTIRNESKSCHEPCMHVNRGILFAKKGSYRDAEEEFKTAEHYYENCLCSKIEMIRMFIDLKKYEEASQKISEVLKINTKFNPALVELLKLCYYLKKNEKIKSICDEILTNNKNTKVIIYKDGEKLTTYKLSEYTNNFSEKLNSYREISDSFSIESGNIMMIYKLYRDIGLCSVNKIEE